MADEEDFPAGTRLRYSLTRGTSRGFQIGCTIAFALILGGGSYPILRYATLHRGTPNNFVMYAVGGGFAFVALLLLYSAIHQLFALATPQTTVEIDGKKLTRGEQMRFFFRQPGPASFESLRANLAGDETWWEGVGKRRHQRMNPLGMYNFFDSGPFDVDGVIPFERLAELSVPADIPPTGEQEGRTRSWRIELWGKVRRRADFHHTFPIPVV